MAQRMRKLFPGRSIRHALGAELRRIRLENDLSQDRLGTLVHHSGALVGKIEKGERLPTAEFCALVDDALKTGGLLSRMRPTADPRIGGVPIEFIASPWNMQTSVQLLHELSGKTARGREFVPLTGANWEAVLAGWRTATPTEAGDSSAQTPLGPSIGSAALDLIAARLASLHALTATLLAGTVLRELVLAELRCLADLIDDSALSVAEQRRLLSLAAQAARLGGRLHHDTNRPGSAQSFYLAALRCTADSDDPLAGAEVLTEMGQDSPASRTCDPGSMCTGTPAVS